MARLWPGWTRRAALWALALLVTALCAPIAGAQPAEPLDITGQTFAGLRLPVAPGSSLELHFSGARVWAWTEEADPGDGASEFPVHRLLLAGDVAMQLGIHQVTAARALVWMQRLAPEAVGGQEGLAQVFIYFDRVATPRAAPSPDAPIAFTADRLSVEGIFRITGPELLQTDNFIADAPARDRFVLEGERALALRLRRLVLGHEPPERVAALHAPETGPGLPDVSRPFDPETRRPAWPDLTGAGATFAGGAMPAAQAPMFARDGVFTISTGDITIVEGDAATGDATVAMITGGVVVQYHDAVADRELLITAQRGVIYLSPQADVRGERFTTPDVLGVYVEGGVMATDGEYTLRSPRMYYDVEYGRALVLDAVFRTYSDALGSPLYVRANAIRQESQEEFSARGAMVSNTAFFLPHLSLGTTSVTLTRAARTPSGWFADARNITLRAGSIPFFYWPIFRGDPSAIPLRAIEFIGSSVSGAGIRTAWDLAATLGVDAPRDLSALLLVDAYFERGAGLGLDLDWRTPDSVGEAILYSLVDDTGTDVLAPGTRRDRDGEFRGIALFEHRWTLSRAWSVFLEGSIISDENFVDAFFDSIARSRREPKTSALARYMHDSTLLTAQIKGNLNDFTVSEHLLQSRGYTVDRLPEATYWRVGEDLLSDAAPGLLTYFSESRIGRIALHFTEKTPDDLGFATEAQAQRAFGLAPDQSIAEALRAGGLSEDPVARLDTRHELAMSLRYGPVNVTPFAVGRFTAYDRDFEEFSGESDQARLFGETGVRIASTFQRIYNGAQSRLLDIHRLRHIITPSATFSAAGSTISQGDLPVYDDGVEDLYDRASLRLGLDQTWQTKRGGPARRRSVDVFTLDTELVFTDGDESDDVLYPRYIGFRPELSSPGNYAGLAAGWQVTEVLGVTARTTYDLDTHQQARTSAGVLLRHSPEFSSFIDYLYSNPHDQTFLSLGAAYTLSDKYGLAARITYDDTLGTIQDINAIITRLYPNIRVGVRIAYNKISNETSASFTLEPVGFGSHAPAFRGIGSGRNEGLSERFGE